ncbi:tetratricopeptide repeat protein [Paraburkholderia jirisanensis]
MKGESDGRIHPMAGERLNAAERAVADTLRRARTLLEQRQFVEAQRLYQGVLAFAPDNVEALHLLGVVLFKSGDVRRAEPLLSRSIQLGLKQAWHFANHGATLNALGRYEQALSVLDQAVAVDATNLSGLMARGAALLGLGRYDDALATYDAVLRLAPGLSDAWRDRGRTLRGLKRPADALISFDSAHRISAGDAQTCVQRGHALRDLGRHGDSLESYRLALVIRPRDSELLTLCGTALIELGHALEALVYFDEALMVRPEDTRALYQSCIALDLLKRHDELLRRCDRLLASNPKYPSAWLGRGNALLGLDRPGEAADAYSKVLQYAPGTIDALRNRAAALRVLGRYTEALADYDESLAIAGPDAELLCNRAIALQRLKRYDDALASYERAAAITPATAQGCAAQGMALQQLGRHEAALKVYEHGLKLDPNHHGVRRADAFCRLLLGDFARGWAQHERRWLDGATLLAHRHADRPQWRGEEIAGKTVLLHAEQGFGDTIQFCRYASLAAQRGATVLLEVPAPLKTLFASLDGVARVFEQGEALPGYDLQCPLMSLPFAFSTRVDSVPARVPYLHTDAGGKRAWSKRLEDKAVPGRLRVGLVWAGNQRHSNDENRSIALADLEPLYRQDLTFVSVQPYERESDRVALENSSIVTFGSALTDFADTAALISELDLVISVDTSVVHLAGAMNLPVWALLSHVPDWRWLLDREDSPWYPAARLFRQSKTGDWQSVIERVAHELSQWKNTYVAKSDTDSSR